MSKCPCGTGSEYAACCEPYLEGKAKPATAEKLMRSRYTAFTKADVDYIEHSTDQSQRKNFDRSGTLEWAKGSKWKGLEIVSTNTDGAVRLRLRGSRTDQVVQCATTAAMVTIARLTKALHVHLRELASLSASRKPGESLTALSCGTLCDKLLNCGKHHCKSICHSVPCEDCPIMETERCYCGKVSKPLRCGEGEEKHSYIVNEAGVIEEWDGKFACEILCGRYSFFCSSLFLSL